MKPFKIFFSLIFLALFFSCQTTKVIIKEKKLPLKNKSYPGHEYANNDSFIVPNNLDIDIEPYYALAGTKLLVLFQVRETEGIVNWKIWKDENTGIELIRIWGKSSLLHDDISNYSFTFSEADLNYLIDYHRSYWNFLARYKPESVTTIHKLLTFYTTMVAEGAMMLKMKFTYGPKEGSATLKSSAILK